MKMYHGTDTKIALLRAGSFVTRNIKDAWKFGYRRAILSKRPLVFIYTAELDETEVKPDPNRDRAFVLLKTTCVTPLKTSSTWASPFKLGAFNMANHQPKTVNTNSAYPKMKKRLHPSSP